MPRGPIAPKMPCPYCSGTLSRVMDRKLDQPSDAYRRQRLCLRCKRRFDTEEKPVTLPQVGSASRDTAA